MLRRSGVQVQTAACAVLLAMTMIGCSAERSVQEPLPPLGENGPLSAYLDVLYRSETASLDSQLDSFAKREAAIADCMKTEGFEYVPLAEPEGGFLSSLPTGKEWSLGTMEFAKNYGYGNVEWPPGVEDIDLPDDAPDVNAEYYSGLTAEGRRAYDRALFGVGASREEGASDRELGAGAEDSSYAADVDPGCFGAIGTDDLSEQDRIDAVFADPEFADLVAAIASFADTELSGAEVEDLNESWRRCMFESPGSISLATTAETPSELRELLSEEYLALGYPAGNEYVDPGDSARRRFQETEIQAAVADVRCQEELGYEDSLRRLQFAAEEQFILEHEDRLGAFVSRHGLNPE